MHERNLELTKRGYELFTTGDLDGLRAMFTDDVIWRTAGPAIFLPEYKGADAVMGYFTTLFERSGGTFKVELVHLMADEARSMAIQRITGEHAGKLIDSHLVLVFEIRDEKVYEVTEYAAEPLKLEAFWS